MVPPTITTNSTGKNDPQRAPLIPWDWVRLGSFQLALLLSSLVIVENNITIILNEDAFVERAIKSPESITDGIRGY